MHRSGQSSQAPLLSGSQERPVTRFAPSPTGVLHLGHVAHALWTWGVAGAVGGRVLIRIEDHDRGRSRLEYERRILEDLEWLGFVPDPDSRRSLQKGPSPWRQSDCDAVYAAAVARLSEAGLVYGCDCSRSTIARQLGDGAVEGEELRYPGPCRERGLVPGPGIGLRVRLPQNEEVFDDLRLGPQRQSPAEQCGDLLVRDKAGNWTYQFAVTVDDLRHGVNLVIRGEDLLSSTGRQMALARLLGRSVLPRFLHHPLIRNEAGVKLSKKDRASGLAELRTGGMAPADVIGLAAWRTGLIPEPEAVPAEDAPGLFLEGWGL
jgi:glutamyl-Q tRNA(Asp) synthetase